MRLGEPPTEAPYLRRIFTARSHSFLGSRSPCLARPIISFATVNVMWSLRSTNSSLRSAAAIIAARTGQMTRSPPLSSMKRAISSTPGASGIWTILSIRLFGFRFVVERTVIYVSAGANVRTTSYAPGSNLAIESASSKRARGPGSCRIAW